jgi:hypothetical protein
MLANRLEKTLNFGEGLKEIPGIERSWVYKLQVPDFQIPDQILVNSRKEKNIDSIEEQYQKIFFSKINISNLTTDIRIIWESARLQQATGYLLLKEKNRDTVNLAKEEVLSWIKNNPFLYGLHYVSPMECGLRVPVFFYLLNNEQVELTYDEEKFILHGIYNHAWWIYRNFALYSSIGNHTICESIGLIFGGAIYQEFSEGKKWLEKGCALLEQELFHQVLEDGGPVEQSFGYHKFVLDLYWLAVGFLEKNYLYDCSSWKKRLMAGDLFLTSMCYANDLYPSIGDYDDGYAVAPGITPARDKDYDVRDVLSSQECKTFDSSGYSVVRQQNGLFLTFDHGPLGMTPLYNHGHADALSITLYKNKKPFLIDPGTYRYNGVPEHRKYFKGTRAHNTVCIDGKDQAEQVTGFIWSKAYESRLISEEIIEGHVRLKASHNGYKRLKNPVEHQREIIIEKESCVLIIDAFKGRGIHTFELNLHLDPNVHIERSNNWIVLKNSGVSISIYNPEEKFTIIYGQNEPLLGWYSPFYGSIEKTHTLQASAEGYPDIILFKTLICLSSGKEKESMQLYNQSKVTM